MDNGAGFGIFSDPLQTTLDLIQELQSEAGALVLIPGERSREVGLRLSPNNDAGQHQRDVMRALTSDHGKPAAGSLR